MAHLSRCGPAARLIVTGMTRQGFQLGLEQRTGQWLALFYRGTDGHHPMTVAGTAQAATPWGAVQSAAWAVVEGKPSQCPCRWACVANGCGMVSIRPTESGIRFTRY